MSDPFPIFQGNCPRAVSKDAKYAIRTHRGIPVVALTYVTDTDERWLATTQEHPELVEMVNAVKTRMGTAPNGPFYINEHGQVIVPVGSDATYYLAGEYGLPLRFIFEDHVLSGEGVDLAGKSVQPGDLWVGPHPGIPYVLRAGQDDIYYNSIVRMDVTKRIRLSSHVGPDAAAALSDRVRRVKGWTGGRLYVNEWRELFVPLNKSTGLEYRYIGHLDLEEPWFPKEGRGGSAQD